MMKQFKGTAMLLLAAMIWGAAFTAQSVGMEFVGPFTFQAARQMLGCLVLLPIIFLRDKAGSEPNRPKTKKDHLLLIGSGALCGFILFCACSLQQFGLLYTTPGKAGFLTALYIIFVPIVGLFINRKAGFGLALSVILAAVGLYFLCMDGSLSLGKGELLNLLCALCFTAHILFLDRISPKVDGVRLSSLQFFFCSVFSIPCMLLTETVAVKDVLSCWLPICYTGILSCGAGYTLQILAQKNTDPTIASITMSMESVFAVVFGWILLGDALGAKEIFGCVLMFAAIVLAQLPKGFLKKKERV